jgi:uncharacterized protein YjbI with pentapeptide repeats
MSFASAIFESCKLDYADLSGQFLERVNFSARSLFQTNLSQANLSQANLTGAVMHEVSLAAADVRGTDFTNADLRHATISEISILDMKSFHGMLVSSTQQSALLETLGIKVVET